MCGIAGIINFKGFEEKEALLQHMIAVLHHRGPDAVGFYNEGAAGLAHARLSIVDLGGGDQPIHNEDKTVWVIFNGEIFNYPELRKELISKGHRFYTESDTEVIVHLYEEFGTGLFSKLNGQFAIALWDQKNERLVLGRDRVGIRPVYYQHQSDRLVFASEKKSLFCDPSVKRELDLQTLSDIFTCWAPLGKNTAFNGISQLPPGNFAVFDRSGLHIESYWQLSFDNEEGTDRTIQDWAEELNALLIDSTRLRLRADVPVGAYLSGGLDSTYISAVVKNNFNNMLRTYSVGFIDKTFDESEYQKRAVSALATDHRSVTCSHYDIGNCFQDIIWHTETPLIRTAPAPLYLLSRLVREDGFKVVLTGEGADEIFAGYNIFKEDKVRRFWAKNPESKMRPALLSKLYPYIFSEKNEKSRIFTTRFFKQHLDQVDSSVFSHMLRWSNTAQIKTFLSDEVRSEIGKEDDFIDRFCQTLPSGFKNWSPLSRAQYIENTVFLSNYLLSFQGDRMAMGNSIEGRYPFLDHRVIEFASRVPHRYRLTGLKEKNILKCAAKGIVPHEVIHRSKQPYRAPISQSFFGSSSPEYVLDLLSDQNVRNSGYFNPNKVATLVKKCQVQKGALVSERENMALVAILSTQILHHKFVESIPDIASKDLRRLSGNWTTVLSKKTTSNTSVRERTSKPV